MRAALVAVFIALGLLLAGAWYARTVLVWMVPIHHVGVVKRIGTFHKGGMLRGDQRTRQVNQFAILFEDGFHCEGFDTALAAVREGDRIHLRGYYDVRGIPFLDPEWGECDEGQLVKVLD